MRRFIVAIASAALMSVTANAADLPMKAAPMAPPPSYFSWTGIYVGINGGWIRDRIPSPYTDPAFAGTFVQPTTSGGVFGGQIGFNWQWQQLVLGVEVDGDWFNLSASAPCANPAFVCSTELKHQYSARARLGYAFDRFLVYVTGGGAWTTLNGSTALGAVVFPGSSARHGWIVGGGAEYAIWSNLILGIEYLHADYGTASNTYDVVYPNIKLTTDEVRARLSWLFHIP